MDDIRYLILEIKKSIDSYLKRLHSTQFTSQNKQIDLEGTWPIYSLKDLFPKYADINLTEVVEDEKALFKRAKEKGYSVTDATWAELFDQILVNEIEPHFMTDPFFVVDFPACLSPLCKVNKDDSLFAERFEWYMGRIELGNGNNEKIDNEFMKKKFNIDASSMQGKTYAGVGTGIDRLVMLFTDAVSIHDIEK